MAFSPDGSLLATVSSPPQGASLALWSINAAGASELVAGVQLPVALAGLAWLPGTELPTFYTVGRQGLLQWQLEPEELASSAVHMPAGLRGVALTAVAACSEAAEESDAGGSDSKWRQEVQRSTSSAAVVVGDGNGRVWRLQLDPTGQDVQSSLLLAELPLGHLPAEAAAACLQHCWPLSGPALTSKQPCWRRCSTSSSSSSSSRSMPQRGARWACCCCAGFRPLRWHTPTHERCAVAGACEQCCYVLECCAAAQPHQRA